MAEIKNDYTSKEGREVCYSQRLGASVTHGRSVRDCAKRRCKSPGTCYLMTGCEASQCNAFEHMAAEATNWVTGRCDGAWVRSA